MVNVSAHVSSANIVFLHDNVSSVVNPSRRYEHTPMSPSNFQPQHKTSSNQKNSFSQRLQRLQRFRTILNDFQRSSNDDLNLKLPYDWKCRRWHFAVETATANGTFSSEKNWYPFSTIFWSDVWFRQDSTYRLKGWFNQSSIDSSNSVKWTPRKLLLREFDSFTKFAHLLNNS